MIKFLLEIPLTTKITDPDKLFIHKPEIEIHFKEKDFEFIAWGDPIPENGFKEKLLKNPTPEFVVNNIFGHYYYILLDKIKDQIYTGNSMFSILPVYYWYDKEKIVLSENAFEAGRFLGINKISARFLLETLLFNYPLFNNSILEGISLLPSNSYLMISDSNVKIVRHTHIEKYFALKPVPWRKAIGEMTDLFLEIVRKYLPDEHYAYSLTGGFDGRTLVSAGFYHKKKFSCYCFGNELSKDIQIALKLAKSAGIPFLGINLNNEYVKEQSILNGQEFIENSSGSATFARAHYLYAAKQLSESYNYIITGNFGSEIFRAVRTQGVVISHNLCSLYSAVNCSEGLKAIEGSDEFKFINNTNFLNAWKDLKEDILRLPCYNPVYSGLTRNQRFYVFVFEELNRKYFGAEMLNQFRYLKNRTPFLDMEFLKALFKTELAGIHSGFFEHSPLKRYKGQVLYANIIKKAYQGFGKIITDKGYRPDDLIYLTGKINIALGYLKKKLNISNQSDDPYSVTRAWDSNKDFWLKVPIPGEFFDLKRINENINRETLFKILSFSYLIDKIYLPPRYEDTKSH